MGSAESLGEPAPQVARGGTALFGRHASEEESLKFKRGLTTGTNGTIGSQDKMEQPAASCLYEMAGVRISAREDCLPPSAISALNKATFRDDRWKNARSYLFGDRLGKPTEEDRELALDLLREGAKAFGVWHVSSYTIAALARQLLGEPEAPSDALEAWIKSVLRSNSEVTHGDSVLEQRVVVKEVSVNEAEIRKAAKSEQWQGYSKAWSEGYVHFAKSDVEVTKVIVTVLVFLCSTGYAIKVVLHMYPDIFDFFGWPIFFARGAGMATAIVTGILYLSMARTASKEVYHLCPFSRLSALFTGHRDLHIHAGDLMLFFGGLHVVAHLIGTAPGVQSHKIEELNAFLGCANPDTTPGYLGVDMSWLRWPKCPLTKAVTYRSFVLQSTIGLSGVLLLILLVAVWTLGRPQRRTKNFDRFWHAHGLAVALWPVLLFVHGSNGWVGVGFPPRRLRSWRAHFPPPNRQLLRRLRSRFGQRVRILEAIIRPGKGGSTEGSLTYLRVSKPPYLWRFSCGEYAFVNMPDYSWFQWHPFTICSGDQDSTVDFLISSVGDWTHELAKRCSAALDETRALPRICLDGPYMAPTQSAMTQKVLIAVGAGVGITPFLSLLASIISEYEFHGGKGIKLQEAHFYWMTRNPDELLFGRKLFDKIVMHPNISDKVFLHLHLTREEPTRNASAFLFREAVRRQSKVDREVFNRELGLEDFASRLVGPQVPWGWVNRAAGDVWWLSHILQSADVVEETQVLQKYAGSWAQGLLKNEVTSGAFVAPESSGISRTRSNLSRTSSLSSRGKGPDWMLPVTFGRPDFATEVRAVGRARPRDDVNMYVCGNDAIVKKLQEVADVCNAHAEKSVLEGQKRPQKYLVHHERFG
eukprot:CAMPEP_0170577638 /NCGR_PEP_ID=MMETSP0224-20130122/5034_1 /TAXON_ID=285029 /ORGANISM="Togula jolla, Strain CCCM 725" /LENGTH=867 /DNA_ID=CAMNT_0010900563 /DNA_START=52 /DNA_END=2656 /DNA_ORIENTATION=+